MGNILLATLILNLVGLAFTSRADFDIFAKRSMQSAVQWSRFNHYKTIAPVDQCEDFL